MMTRSRWLAGDMDMVRLIGVFRKVIVRPIRCDGWHAYSASGGRGRWPHSLRHVIHALPFGPGRATRIACCVIAFLFVSVAHAADQPNIVFIMTDNHGAWTLGCYGNEDIRTPNIDRLASEGTLFENAFASNPVCSPTRATFLTGLLPSQHGVHCFLRGGRLQVGPDSRCTLDEITSLPEVLKQAGYACGLVGKWHLGANLTPQEGFDNYWITMPHGGTSTFYDAQIIENGEVRKEPEYLTDFWTGHAVKFIEQQAADESDKPFFLFLAYNGPYSLSRLLLRDGKNRHADYYADQELSSFPREPAHPWQFSNLDYHNNPTSIRRVATEVSGVDDGVGTVMETLAKHGMDDNTIVVFVADQGWAGGHGGFFGMGDHTRPVTADEEMMRIPMIWRQPGKIAAGQRSDRMVTNYDFMPTLLSHVGLGQKMPTEPKSPGRDFSSELANGNNRPRSDADDAIFYEFEGLRCIRTECWKYVHRHSNGPHELYDLKNDPDEFTNLVSSESHATTRDRLKKRLNEFYAKYAEPKYDLWNGGGSQTVLFEGVDEELAQADPVEPPALTAGFMPQVINVPDGFEAELAAGPPLVEHPTFATFDDRGRLFVCENAGVNLSAEELEQQRPNSIRLLEDSDSDGRFDKSTIFADKMTFPMGGAWHDGALYVASPPSIWRLADTDGDGVADDRKVIVDKFGYTGNAASIHGCVKGLDGRMYWCDGYHGHEFTDDEGNVTSKRRGSYIFSCLPNGRDVRIHCGGGMDNPVEVDFTDEGEMLGTVNILYTRPRIDCLVHWLYGGAYPHREQVLEELKVTGDLLEPVHRFGHVAVSGTMRYRSGVMDYRWRDNMFATFFNSGKVVRLELERDAATFKVNQREFLSCDSREFHPTDVVEDADGSLLVIDTGGWFYRGCPTSQFAKPDVLGGIYRVRRTGMTTQVDLRGNRIEWDSLTDADVVKLLGDTKYAVRERAIDECARRGDDIIPLLRQQVERGDILYRRGALWALTRMIGNSVLDTYGRSKWTPARGIIQTALSDRDQTVRQIACRSLATYPDPSAVDGLIKLLNGDVPEVQREAATALGQTGVVTAVSPLLSVQCSAGNDVDRAIDHAAIYALIEINDAQAVRAGLSSNDPVAKRRALIALDQMDTGTLDAAEVVEVVDSNDAELRRAAVAIFERHEQWRSQSADVLRRLLKDSNSISNDAALLERLISQSLAEASVANLVGDLLTEPASSDLALKAIARGQSVPLHKSWVQPLEKMLANTSGAEPIEPAISAVAAIQGNQFRDRLNSLGNDQSLSPLVRVAALEAASGRRGSLSDESFQLLLELLGGGPGVSLSAAQKLGSSSLSKQQLIDLAPSLTAATSSQLNELIRVYQRSGDAEVAAKFLEAMDSARSLTSLSSPQFSDTIKKYPRELLPAANKLLDRIRQAEQQKVSRLDAMLPLVALGDAERGKALFFSEKSKCSSCHKVGSEGGKIGPDLTTIGANRAVPDLLESVLFPSATLVRDYEPYSLIASDGRVLSGLIVRETADAITIQQQTGDPITLSRDDVEEMVPSTVSIMPTDLEKSLTKEELAHLVAYLVNLTSAPKQE